MLIVTSLWLMRVSAVPAAATVTTTTKRENKSTELEEGMFSLLRKYHAIKLDSLGLSYTCSLHSFNKVTKDILMLHLKAIDDVIRFSQRQFIPQYSGFVTH